MGVETPECEKLQSVSDTSQEIGAFLDWLQQEKGCVFSRYVGSNDRLVVDTDLENKERLLAEYFNIDLDKVEAERRALIKELREANKVKP